MANTTSTSLDVFILTFNAAKHQISAPIFANHLYDAFKHNAASVPELVVVSIQEIAPIAKAFIGSYMLSPFLQRFETAVHLASARYLAEDASQDRSKGRLYTLMSTRNVGMTAIMLFARDPTAVRNIQAAEVAFGAGDMANKGAVALRMLYEKEAKVAELTFVSTHLEAMEWNLEKRNKNWQSIVSGLVFQDPRTIISRHRVGLPASQSSEDCEETETLLEQDSTQDALHKISIYKPGTHLFVAGDLNYRISNISPSSQSAFPELDAASPNYYMNFFPRDQLNTEKSAGRTLHGLSEATITFPPSYKLRVAPEREPKRATDDATDQVIWNWASHRWPSWCDRVLFLDIPWWAQTRSGEKMKTTAYSILPAVHTSDHRAVFLRLDVPIIEPSKLAPSEVASTTELAPGWQGPVDPRIKLPFPVNLQSWEHRARVKKWETMIGWSTLFSQSKPGIMVFVTVLLIGLGTWWLRSQ